MVNKTIADLITVIAVVAVTMYVVCVGTSLAADASEPTLASGYEWYQDDEFSYKIGYPENWEKNPLTVSEGQEAGIFFSSTSAPCSISVTVFSDPTQARWWENGQVSLEELKESGMVTEYGEITINDREGYEVVYHPMPTVKSRWIEFTVDDLYYVVNVYAPEEEYDKYAETFETAINSFVIEYPAPVTPTPTPSPTPGFEAAFVIAGVLAVAYILKRMG